MTMRVEALAVDFGGTLARPGPNPDAAIIAEALHGLPGTVIPDGFAAAFDDVTRQVRAADRQRGEQTPFAEQLRRSGVHLPNPAAAAEAVFTAVPDADVDPRAADALRQLRRMGLVCVLACDTQRPESVRRRTLDAAGIGDCFDALVLSSTLGVRKPHPRCYAAVIAASGCPPERIMFVGDTPAKDAVAPYTYGMRATLISPSGRPEGLDPAIGVITHLSDLPAYLEGLS
ncbi:haloacid dehalogenase superfamily, subfamily IA, variant 3 with third motif having DD or ED [Streptosporangium canum]|uniref:Haloacid dehalogenase superfamily, subfamily IA, variant 3 with third motif having DD or ED n=1 Tax=Streptosporangium canum TaxID=324952 RepID=A0A1I3XLY2_9ACTN|nr:HAD family hydrolase [Streptosporangium canum]SFK20041.1 haloacid dehalogenase superfamily, subfamily IA, variant 3 with third motif having DD or ED [Streptosporangium canum]